MSEAATGVSSIRYWMGERTQSRLRGKTQPWIETRWLVGSA